MRSQKIVALLTCVNLAVLGTLLAGAAAPTNPTDKVAPTVVRAQAIELVDGEGNVRVQLYLAQDGGGAIRMRDARGEVRVKMDAQPDGGKLLFLDKNTEPGAALAADEAGNALTLYGPDKQTKVISP